jgi:hypothetical protein
MLGYSSGSVEAVTPAPVTQLTKTGQTPSSCAVHKGSPAAAGVVRRRRRVTWGASER